MLFTDQGTKVNWQWCPLAFANGLEWSRQRRGFRDRFDCLYQWGLTNKLLWYCGALTAVFINPHWMRERL